MVLQQLMVHSSLPNYLKNAQTLTGPSQTLRMPNKSLWVPQAFFCCIEQSLVLCRSEYVTYRSPVGLLAPSTGLDVMPYFGRAFPF